MEPIFKRMNLVKSLVPKLSTSFDFESLNAGFDKFRSSVCLTDKFKDDIIMEVYKVYASLSKLLHENNGEIQQKESLMIGEEISNMVKCMEEDNNKYLPYFYMLSTFDEEPLTIEKLKDRYNRIKNTDEYANNANSKQSIEKEQSLLVAYFVLTNIVNENGGDYKNPDRLMQMETATFYCPDKHITWELEEDAKTYKEINEAKLKSARNYLPVILLREIDGKISKETVEENYNIFLKLNPLGKNMDHNLKVEFETIYQAIRDTVSEYDRDINGDDKKEIIQNYVNNIPNVDLKVAISMMLKDNKTLSSSMVLITLNDLINDKKKNGNEKDSIKDIIMSLDVQFIYIVLDDFIKKNGGKCTSEQAKHVLEEAKRKVEEYKEFHKRENITPLEVFPITSEEDIEERYYDLLYNFRDSMKTNVKTIDDVYSQRGLIEACREYYNIVKNPEKRRELETVKFKVDQSDSYSDIGVSDIKCIRNRERKDITEFQNTMGDKIKVTEIGKLSYSAFENTINDSQTNLLYLITKIYNNTGDRSDLEKEKKFLIFSKYLNVNEIKNNPTLYSLYADQIFSDISLETAIEKNGKLIGYPIKCKDEITQREFYQIVFDINALAACIDLDKVSKEFDDILEETSEDKKWNPKLARRIKGGALIGASNIPLSKGYATVVMLHGNGTDSKDDALFGIEWSEDAKNNTIFNRIKNSSNRDGVFK